MLDLKALLAKMLNDFHGCNAGRTEHLSGTTVTPTHNGWLVVAALSTVSSGPAPVARIGSSGGALYAEGVGVVSNGAMLLASCPVKAGITYKITLYRCNLSSVINYY